MATAEDAARFIALESDDYDGMGGAKGYGWARASTEDVARGIHVGTEEAFRLLKAAKRKKLVIQVEGMRKTLGRETGRHREREVGWALWEVHLDRAQTIERDGSARAPDERAAAFHKSEPALEDMARGEQVTGRDLLRAAAAVDLEVDSKLERLLDKPSVWVRPRLSNLTTDASNREAIELYDAVLAAKDKQMTPNAYKSGSPPRILIVTSNVVSDAELDQHGLSTRRYMRIGPSGTGQRIRPTAIDTIKVETHPEWARSTGERYARLNWCEACAQYTEWAGGECTNCPGGADGGEPDDGYEPNASTLALSSDRGTVEKLRAPIDLVHYTGKLWAGRPRIDQPSRQATWGGADWRIIPRSFSLGLDDPNSGWRGFGNKAIYFRLKTGSTLLSLDDEQFRKWGKPKSERAERGALIRIWCEQHGIDAVLLDLRRMDIEYAVLNTEALRRL